ncbi:MAG TPA: FCD domain-containing protein [Usitatibacteraceae bacterium]|nr:FCD domain-containing protein [Usitatibacteraceae bacterium]
MFPWNHDRPPSPLAALRDVSLSKVVREDILGLILRGDIAPGSRINEPDVAERLGVSRVPVREALRELESTGLVVSRKNVGVFVREFAPREVADLYELRAVLDGHAGTRAAALAEAPRRALSRILDAATAAMRKAARRGDVPAYYAENLRFHWAIVEAAGNEKLSDTYRGIVQQLHLWRLRNLAQPVGMAASVAEHEAIAKAIRDADPAGAGRLLADHVGAARQRLEQHLSEEKTP